ETRSILHFSAQDFNEFRAEDIGEQVLTLGPQFLTGLSADQRAQVVNFSLGDEYVFQANEGASLQITTSVPTALRLYDPNGELVASGNAPINYTVPTDAAGTYRVAVSGAALYTLAVSGATGTSAVELTGGFTAPQFPVFRGDDAPTELVLSLSEAV